MLDEQLARTAAEDRGTTARSDRAALRFLLNGWDFRERQLADSKIAGITVIVVSAANGHELNANAGSREALRDRLLSAVEHVCFDGRRA